MNFIEDNFKEQISNYTNYSFDVDGVEYENILDKPPWIYLITFNKTKKICFRLYVN
jgi:hypothetical protein